MEKFKKGQRVTVISLEHTEREFGMNDRMFKMIDTIQIVDYADDDSVRLDGCYWKNEDIRAEGYTEERKPRNIQPQIFHFDPVNLER